MRQLIVLIAFLEWTRAVKRLPDFRQFSPSEHRVLHDDVALDDELNSASYGLPPPTSRRQERLPTSVSRDKQVFAYGAVSNSLDSNPTHSASSFRDPAGGVREPSLQNEKQVVTGIPDLSDPCFRRYANSIIVNAQPYERRSSISLVQCKTQCLLSQVGVYSCRSFVYDNVNQVCDLFAHVGDQSPARLLRFQTRDYFEPTAAVTCKPPEQHEDGVVRTKPVTQKPLDFFDREERTTTSIIQPTTPPPQPEIPLITTQEPQAIAAISELTPTEAPTPDVFSSAKPLDSPHNHNTMVNNLIATELEKNKACETGQLARFLKTSDFELHQHDDMRLESVTLDECIEFCSSPTALKDISPNAPQCNSFEYDNDGICVLSRETAVPLGNGQLKQKAGTDYYERICIEEKLAGECPSSVYNRFPQKILVGFAETVVDAPSLQHCFDNCLNSRQLYGFKCASGMFYFEEPQLNCILNTEDRTTQPDLFTSENSDLVDYFETSCNTTSAASRRFAAPRRRTGPSKRKDFVEKLEVGRESRILRSATWSEWSSCSGDENVQVRKKICEGKRVCGTDRRKCESSGKEMTIAEMVEQIRRNGCPPDVCCPILGKCFGIIQKSATKRLEWCTVDCRK
ncbi:unnamed protein product [Bursaphelenchus xylophilus]|uniref:(pine wood nematode) hypothetical protein n=1 Tax=Bursaphelenchus xylophilus TaxID=6326 RepID=A0A1I7SQH5_BURXY|nr:unnamed protein product [Bursaphelenchus xylophilus]CAG9109908.1 unnamed protein product [Bursaphelenchus xylophilus]